MPGIAGILGGGNKAENRQVLGSMLDCMLHEEFYTTGTYVNDELELWVGWVCHRGSVLNCLPIWNGRRDICLLIVGEDFSNHSTGERLDQSSDAPETAQYLVRLYEEGGAEFLQKLNGWFVGVLIDLRQKKAILFNDRYGLNRTYYHEENDLLFFASEAKSLLKVLPETRRLDPTSLGEFLSCGCALQNRTLFSGVHLLPPASAWTYSPSKRWSRRTYFDKASWEGQLPLSPSDYYQQLRDTWRRVLPPYLSGARQVGMSLTGGVDSRMILAWAPCAPGTLPCYTFGGPYRECADVRLGREVARIARQPHQILMVGTDFLSKFPSLAEKTVYISDGAMDMPGTVDLYIQILARQVAPVRLSGVYGGEILRSTVVFKPQRLAAELFAPEMTTLCEAARSTYAMELGGHRLSFIAFKQAAWYMTARFSIEHSQITFRTPYLDNDLVQLAFRTPPELTGSNDPSLRLIAEGNPAMGRLATDRGLAIRALPGATRALNLLQEFTFKAEYAYDYGMPQWLAKANYLVKPLHLERLWLGRHKFYHFRTYYQNELSGYVKEILLDSRSRSRPYVNGSFLEKMVSRHVSGRGNYTSEIHKLLTCELLQRLLIDQQ